MQVAGNLKSVSGVVVFYTCLLFIFSVNMEQQPLREIISLTSDLNKYLYSYIISQERQKWSYVLFLPVCKGDLNYFWTWHFFEL